MALLQAQTLLKWGFLKISGGPYKQRIWVCIGVPLSIETPKCFSV